MGKDIVALYGDWGNGERTSLLTSDREGNLVAGAAAPATTPEAIGALAKASITNSVSTSFSLTQSVDDLPESLQQKMAETLMISPMKGGAKAAEAALMGRLDDEELEAYHRWVEWLSEEEIVAIRGWFNGEFR